MARAKERRRASARRRVETHDTGGGSNYVKLPEGYGFLRIKAGKYRLDFMSYVCKKGRGDDGGNPFFEKGELAFERTFYVHRDVGPNGDWHLCAAKTFGKPCPICEYRGKLARDPKADEDVVKELAPKERQLWIVKDLSEPDQVQVMEMSHHLFGKQLDAKIRSGDEEDGYEYFADPVDGFTVRVNFEQSDRGKWVEATDIEFKPRREKYDEDVVDEMPDLDELLVATPYDKLKRLFLQTDDVEDEDEDDVLKKKSAPKKTKATEGILTADEAGLEEGDRVYYSGGVCEIVRISKDGSSLTLEDEDGEIFKSVGCDEVKKQEAKTTSKKAKQSKVAPLDVPDEDDEEDDDEPAPKKRPVKKAKPEPEEEDDDDWGEEEEEPAPKKKPAAKGKTPAKKAKDDDDWDEWDD